MTSPRVGSGRKKRWRKEGNYAFGNWQGRKKLCDNKKRYIEAQSENLAIRKRHKVAKVHVPWVKILTWCPIFAQKTKIALVRRSHFFSKIETNSEFSCFCPKFDKMTTEQSEINLVCILSQKARSLKVIIGLRIGFMVAFKCLFLEVYLCLFCHVITH